jgi:hypothetical protein
VSAPIGVAREATAKPVMLDTGFIGLLVVADTNAL